MTHDVAAILIPIVPGSKKYLARMIIATGIINPAAIHRANLISFNMTPPQQIVKTDYC